MRRILTAGIVAVIGVVGFPAGALGSTGCILSPAISRPATHPLALLRANGTDGYQVAICAYRAHGTTRVSLTAARRTTYATYTVPGSLSHGQLTARFPRLGRVAVRFSPIRARLRVRHTLTPGRTFGAFSGTIRFRGENNFVAVAAHTASGWLASGRRSPHSDHNRNEQWQRRLGLHLMGSSSINEVVVNSGDVRFSAARRRSAKSGDLQTTIWFTADSLEIVGDMTIYRSTGEISTEKEATFQEDSQGDITLTPPPPFSGSGTYSPDVISTAPGLPQTEHVGVFSGSVSFPLPGLASTTLGHAESARHVSRVLAY